ncbi:MAG: site-specific DNA-methyltransferase [candidate division Zixibacteria bacterium]|nr:site-specific DNA-methyltransferase [candidate division Zixibacteria bacterium]
MLQNNITSSTDKISAPRNKTLTLKESEKNRLKKRLIQLESKANIESITNSTIIGDMQDVVSFFPDSFVDLLFLDPPYNLNKSFKGQKFKLQTAEKYEALLESWLIPLLRLLKPTASVYICGDWRSAGAISNLAGKYFQIQNRITWEREKGRGAKYNWKNCSEDIWFCTMSKEYKFNVNAVKVRRKVIAPYRDIFKKPKDWTESSDGNYRLTSPSNLWNDITVPFWSMPENTEHPTQKPEKLLAKIILASSDKGDLIFDPFLGSGTTSVVAKKLDRKYLGIERELDYCLIAEKRLRLAAKEKRIQGFENGIFRERNS